MKKENIAKVMVIIVVVAITAGVVGFKFAKNVQAPISSGTSMEQISTTKEQSPKPLEVETFNNNAIPSGLVVKEFKGRASGNPEDIIIAKNQIKKDYQFFQVLDDLLRKKYNFDFLISMKKDLVNIDFESSNVCDRLLTYNNGNYEAFACMQSLGGGAACSLYVFDQIQHKLVFSFPKNREQGCSIEGEDVLDNSGATALLLRNSYPIVTATGIEGRIDNVIRIEKQAITKY